MKKNNFDICPECGAKMLNLGMKEYRCKACDKFYWRGREIMYSEAGNIIDVKEQRILQDFSGKDR